MRKGRAMEGVRQMIAYILRPESFTPPSVWFLSKDITRGIIIAHYNNSTLAFYFGTANVCGLLPYYLSIMT